MRKGLLFLLILVSGLSARANNVQLKEMVKVVSVSGGVATLEVDLSWENSWRDTHNWDGVWLFFKYKSGVDGAWQHATVNAATAAVTGGDYTTMSATTAATAQGLFVYPSKDRGENTGNLKVQVQWATAYTQAQFKDNDVFVVAHGIEMVYIPYGRYTIGDGSSAGAFPQQIIGSELAWNGASAAFPKGYQGFYVMKYETSQEEYVEFINTLTLAEQTALIPGVDALNVGDFVFGGNKSAPNYRNGVVLADKKAGKSLRFDNNLNNNTVYCEEGDGGTLAMNYMSIADAQGYASWAGLRPMTEMEYEKACRRSYPQEPEAGEFAWNSATGAVNATGLTMQGSGRETTATGNVNAGGTIDGPVRCGAFARSSSPTQASTGATYWGVMEMSGNVSELCANITNTTISKTGNGTGAYNASLYGTVPNSYGTRGGGFSDTHTTLTTSSRAAVSRFTSALERDRTVGFRCAFTYDAAGVVNAGTIAFSGNVSAVCPGESITIVNVTDANAGDFPITGYEWYINGVVVPGAVETSLTLNSVVGGRTYSIVRKAICLPGEASTAVLTIQVIAPKPLAGTITGGSRCGVGEVAVRNATPTSITCGLPITYSWWVGGKEIAGQQGESLTHTFIAYGSIPVIRRATANGAIADATTTVTVTSPAPQAGSITAATSPHPINTPVTISNGALGSVSCGSLTYSWFVNGVAVAGNGSSLTYTFTSSGTFTVIRRTTASNGGAYADASATVSVVNCGAPVYDSQGNGYTTKFMADNRCWMTQNMRRTDVTYIYANNSASNAVAHGCYYNWSVVMQGSTTAGARGICPVGWHIPTDGEWQVLINAYGGDNSAGTSLKNSSIFNMTLSGMYGSSKFGTHGYCWSSSSPGEAVFGRYVTSTYASVYRTTYDKANRYSVRCVQD